jgi:hypothetical protein
MYNQLSGQEAFRSHMHEHNPECDLVLGEARPRFVTPKERRAQKRRELSHETWVAMKRLHGFGTTQNWLTWLHGFEMIDGVVGGCGGGGAAGAIP